MKSKPQTGDSSDILTGRYTSSDERGSVKYGPRKNSSSVTLSSSGFYSVPDENETVLISDSADSEEPVVIGEINNSGVYKHDGQILQQGERYITNKKRNGFMSIKPGGEVSSVSFTTGFIGFDEYGGVTDVSSQSAYQRVIQNPDTGNISMETGVASLSGGRITYVKNGSIDIDKNGVINLN